MKLTRHLIPGLLLASVVGAAPANAADLPPSVVGRIGAVEGGASLRPAGGEWADSVVNEPVAAGMAVRTDAHGRARLRLGADIVALAPDSEISFVQLDASGTEIVLHKGRIGVRLSAANPAHSIEIDLSRGGVWLLTPGDYDVAAGDEQAPARVAVLDGRARFVGKGIDTEIAGGSAASLNGKDPVIAATAPAASDPFDARWRPSGRDEVDSQALRYLTPDMTGYDALDGNGSWDTVAGYGAVWFPAKLPADWAPYRDGHWRWIPPWGWTWIDDMQWGFAPSHYGRWAMFPGAGGAARGWGWVPGKRVAHPAFMPAAVAFLGTAGVGLSYPDASGPAVAWFPLGPREAYWPWYKGGDLAAIRRTNEASVDDVSAIVPGPGGGPPPGIVDGEYKNRRYASVVPRAVFVGGKPVQLSLIGLPGRRLDNAPVLAGSPWISPPAARPAAATIVAAARPSAVVHTLARILQSHGRMALARLHHPRLVRLPVIHAVFRRESHRQLHFASYRRHR